MTLPFNKLKKLRGRSFDELRVRGRQALSAYSERYGLSSLARVPADSEFCRMLTVPRIGGASACADGLLAHFRTRPAPRFFAGFDGREQTVAEWRRRWPRAQRRAEDISGRAAAGRFDLLGLKNLCFGEPVNWHLEPLSGKSSPLLHWSRIGELDAGATGDKKIVWELNRHQHFVTLGRAYWHTQDEVHAQRFSGHVRSWMEQNPPALGVNWISNLEVAFRSISWLWALHYFKDSPHLTPRLFLQIFKYLYLHGLHLETYLSTYVSPNTHLTGEALGLFYLGTMLPELPPAARWRELGRGVLLRELGRHVRRDGVYFEQTSYYHRYTTDFYTHFYLLSEANGQPPGAEVGGRLTALLDHLMYITKPDGMTPLFGDDDGGRLLMPGESAGNDFRAALSTGAALLGRPDYKFASGGAAEETLWLLGPEGLRTFDGLDARPPADCSRAFPDGGYYVMRDGWEPDANYLLIDGGPHGEPTCGHAHAHADALSFELSAYGRTLLVDPGTYSYTGSREMRDYFRSSAAHNTLTLDGEPSSVPGGPFSWKEVAHVSTRRWVSRQRFDLFEGQHDGYARLASPAAHTRSVLFVKGHYWIVRDRVTSAGPHLYSLHFHFAPDAAPDAEAVGSDHDSGAAAVRERKAAASGLDLLTFGGPGEWRRSDEWVSNCYGERSPAPAYTFSKNAEGPQEFVTVMIPRRAGAAGGARARELRADGGRVFELLNEGGRDILILGGGGRVTAEAIGAECEWAVVRYGHDGALRELLLLGGRRLELGGRTVFKSAERIGYLTAQFVGDAVCLDADAGASFRVAASGAARALINGAEFATGGASEVEVAAGAYVPGGAAGGPTPGAFVNR